jgi:hypothetical protein
VLEAGLLPAPVAPHAMFPAGWPGISLVDPRSWRGTP